jgi:tetratricopeptide (TPR) repeat protein
MPRPALFMFVTFMSVMICIVAPFEQHPSDAPGLLAKANELSVAGAYGEAETLYRRCAALRPDSNLPWVALAQAWNKMGRQQEAVELLGFALTIERNAIALDARSHLLKAVNRKHEAEADLLEAISIDREQWVPLFNLGLVYDEQGDMEESYAAYSALWGRIVVSPDWPRIPDVVFESIHHVALAWGTSYALDAEPFAMIDALQLAAIAKPEWPIVHLHLAAMLHAHARTSRTRSAQCPCCTLECVRRRQRECSASRAAASSLSKSAYRIYAHMVNQSSAVCSNAARCCRFFRGCSTNRLALHSTIIFVR